MRFTEYGSRELPTILFIHGSCTTAEICYGEIAEKLSERRHCVVVHLDGHEPDKRGSFISLDKECEKIERFVMRHYGGEIFGLTGLSLGATICVHLMTRGRIRAERILLDGVYCVDVGFLQTWVNIIVCTIGIKYLKMGGKVHDRLVEKIFGKGNSAVVQMLFEGMTAASVKNVCTEVYRYRLSPKIAKCDSEILCIRGEYEPIPERSFALLKKHLPQINEQVIPDCGHSQLLHEHGGEYCEVLSGFFNSIEL
ncbi:Pimeloyl-ACP methyl ester carboxylesterase [Ruminococcus sp. YE71]|uniref:alpha/beta fold hydrolase n=1 Tax=unclassified Ruminococcus TaxID=2608920 RepID=UPI00088A99EF|nr:MULTISPECIES: alpha/beta hydrolase [unclassified Ruminococcus]SDA26013.1 Pimeloyl-ACP methyl ester carboxylesterase [Ruminococcus sp. YE78]SFW35778.1 Pimeloyl-ACP methyl ester carboxylesterase [Ruminococcus sp. YE71]